MVNRVLEDSGMLLPDSSDTKAPRQRDQAPSSAPVRFHVLYTLALRNLHLSEDYAVGSVPIYHAPHILLLSPVPVYLLGSVCVVVVYISTRLRCQTAFVLSHFNTIIVPNARDHPIQSTLAYSTPGTSTHSVIARNSRGWTHFFTFTI